MGRAGFSAASESSFWSSAHWLLARKRFAFASYKGWFEMAYTAHANEGRMPRKIVVLGSTGSIGTQTLDVARRHPDKLEVIALAANSSVDAVLAQAHEFRVRNIAFGNAELARDARLASAHGGVKVGLWPRGGCCAREHRRGRRCGERSGGAAGLACEL